MPLDLQQELAGDRRLWEQYCHIFLRIMALLQMERSPTPHTINLALGESRRLAELSRFALDYLLKRVEDVGQRSSILAWLEQFPICWNDFAYSLIRESLLSSESKGYAL